MSSTHHGYTVFTSEVMQFSASSSVLCIVSVMKELRLQHHDSIMLDTVEAIKNILLENNYIGTCTQIPNFYENSEVAGSESITHKKKADLLGILAAQIHNASLNLD